jgi:hypothetical protein
MDNQNIPHVIFLPLEIAEVKDKILKYLYDISPTPISSEIVYNELKLTLPIEDYNEYLKEMKQANYIITNEVSGSRKILRITDKGKIFHRGGGYVYDTKNELNETFDKYIEEEKKREKLDLEIQNLKAGMKHYKSTRVIAIIALVISGLSFLYLIFKDVFLPLIIPPLNNFINR